MLSKIRITKASILFGFFLACFIIIICRLFYLQVLDPFSLTADYLKTRKISPERGRVFDRNKEPVAMNQTTYQLFAEPKKIEEKDKIIRKLSEVLEIDQASIEAKIQTDKFWVPIKNEIDKKTKEKIEALNLKGLGFDEEFRRFYPESSLSAHLMGFVGKNKDGDNLGYFGIEGFYEKDLVGLPGLVKSEQDLAGRPIFFGTQKRIDPENGRDLILTIDKAVQQIVKNRLKNGLEKYQAKEGCVIVADPSNMEILALSCLPDFDPEKYYLFSGDYYKDPVISNLYEPGSIFKPLIMAAAIEEKAIKPDEIYDEKGPVAIGEYTIRTWNNQYEGKISMTRILEKSSNVGMVYIGEKLGKDKLYQYFEKYGLGETTGIDLQGEEAGFLKPKSQWYPIDFSTVTFGQGIALTPIQMIRAFASVINGGKLYVPEMVKIMVSDNREQNIKPKVERKIISEKTSEIIKKMLVSSVDNGDAKWAKPKGYKIGGKTGTAQIPIQGHYDVSKTNASFIGFAPVDNPKFIVLVVLNEPKSSPWGSETAAPLFFEIAKELILYYNIAPDK